MRCTEWHRVTSPISAVQCLPPGPVINSDRQLMVTYVFRGRRQSLARALFLSLVHACGMGCQWTFVPLTQSRYLNADLNYIYLLLHIVTSQLVIGRTMELRTV